MDRYDEDKHVNNPEGEPREDDERQDMRQGDVLGLSGTEVPKAPDDPTTEYDEESVAKRRERAAGAGEGRVADRTSQDRSKGATGIDMGSGGSGTDLKSE
jgi:hypothetical protein